MLLKQALIFWFIRINRDLMFRMNDVIAHPIIKNDLIKVLKDKLDK